MCLSNSEAQWHHPISVTITSPQKSKVSLTTTTATTATATASTPSSNHSTSKSISANSSMPFRELLLHSKYSLESSVGKINVAGGESQHSRLASPESIDIMSSSSSSAAIAAAAASSIDEQDRLAFVAHFQERDRLILQHQRQQLQQKQRGLSDANSEHDAFGVDRVIDRISVDRKSAGKQNEIIPSISLLNWTHFDPIFLFNLADFRLNKLWTEIGNIEKFWTNIFRTIFCQFPFWPNVKTLKSTDPKQLYCRRLFWPFRLTNQI